MLSPMDATLRRKWNELNAAHFYGRLVPPLNIEFVPSNFNPDRTDEFTRYFSDIRMIVIDERFRFDPRLAAARDPHENAKSEAATLLLLHGMVHQACDGQSDHDERYLDEARRISKELGIIPPRDAAKAHLWPYRVLRIIHDLGL